MISEEKRRSHTMQAEKSELQKDGIIKRLLTSMLNAVPITI